MRLLITAGGTGGHVYPALAVAQALTTSSRRRIAEGRGPAAETASQADEPPATSSEAEGDGNGAARRAEILWVGAAGGMEAELVARAGLRFEAVQGGGLHGLGLRALPNLARLGVGFFQALRIVGRFQPQALLVTGGFVAAPVALAAWLRRVPSLVYLPDVEPGLAVRLLSRLARRVAVTVEESRRYFPGRRVAVTGYPVRADLRSAARAEARTALGLSPDEQTLLVFGGSRGARSLNRALLGELEALLADCQVIHVTGTLDWPEVSARSAGLPEHLQRRYRAFAYLHEAMGQALAAADLAVARAGASTLGELPLFGLPAVLVPYPHAWRYQKVNADYLAAHGAAVRLNDEELPGRLAPLARELLGDRPRLAGMARAMRALARPGAAAAIANELQDMAGARP